MKKLLTLFAFAFSIAAFAQVSFCDAKFTAVIPQVTFSGNLAAWGDSVLTIPIINQSGIGFAYPQAKLYNQTPLPPGMTLNPNFSWWMPFASAWNNNDTALCHCEYDVTQPIPANYMVTFRLWLRPNDTAVGYDSCRFSQDFTLNLNPQVGMEEWESVPVVSVFPVPAQEKISFSAGNWASAKMFSADGRYDFSFVNNGAQSTDISALPAGMYFVLLYDREGKLSGKTKLVKQ